MQPEETNKEEINKEFYRMQRRGKVMGGLLVVAIGTLFLLRELGTEIPQWLMSWKTLLIGIGLVTAVKHSFRHPAWIVLVTIGGAFLFNDFYPQNQFKAIMWPLLAIAIGLYMIFKPRRKHGWYEHRHWKRWHHHGHGMHTQNWQHWEKCQYDRHGIAETTDDQFFESNAVMAGIKKNILSKDFKSGEINTVFGGTEVNFMQADISGSAKLEVNVVFGGVRLFVPANWQVRSNQLVAVLGSVEDKRSSAQVAAAEETKQLILTGSAVFGGIEIITY